MDILRKALKSLFFLILFIFIADAIRDYVEAYINKNKTMDEIYGCTETHALSPNDNRPDILIFGDSISAGYHPSLQTIVPKCDFVRDYCNAFHSNYGTTKIKEVLLHRQKWRAVIFNHGQWDIASYIDSDINDYKKNLELVIKEIKKHTNNIYFALTTSVPQGNEHRKNEDVLKYNQVARKIMASYNIKIIDLYSVSLGLSEDRISSTDIHFTEGGSQKLAEEIAQNISNHCPN